MPLRCGAALAAPVALRRRLRRIHVRGGRCTLVLSGAARPWSPSMSPAAAATAAGGGGYGCCCGRGGAKRTRLLLLLPLPLPRHATVVPPPPSLALLALLSSVILTIRLWRAARGRTDSVIPQHGHSRPGQTIKTSHARQRFHDPYVPDGTRRPVIGSRGTLPTECGTARSAGMLVHVPLHMAYCAPVPACNSAAVAGEDGDEVEEEEEAIAPANTAAPPRRWRRQRQRLRRQRLRRRQRRPRPRPPLPPPNGTEAVASESSLAPQAVTRGGLLGPPKEPRPNGRGSGHARHGRDG